MRHPAPEVSCLGRAARVGRFPGRYPGSPVGRLRLGGGRQAAAAGQPASHTWAAGADSWKGAAPPTQPPRIIGKPGAGLSPGLSAGLAPIRPPNQGIGDPQHRPTRSTPALITRRVVPATPVWSQQASSPPGRARRRAPVRPRARAGPSPARTTRPCASALLGPHTAADGPAWWPPATRRARAVRPQPAAARPAALPVFATNPATTRRDRNVRCRLRASKSGFPE
jgi:hypothetical protein